MIEASRESGAPPEPPQHELRIHTGRYHFDGHIYGVVLVIRAAEIYRAMPPARSR